MLLHRGILAVTVALLAFASPFMTMAAHAQASPEDQVRFETWLDEFRTHAIENGISPETAQSALTGLQYSQRVTKANEQQPEFTRAIWEYLDGAVSDLRIERGKTLLVEHGELFKQIEADYGVQGRYIVAIWGLESNFGSFMGNHSIVEALATLGFEGRRTKYGRTQLLAALQIIDNGDKPLAELTGSWAGAMGHTQFIPTTYLAYAVDRDGDARRDLWSSLPDVFASTANYLSKSAWTEKQDWGREVVLPDNFDYASADPKLPRTLSEWRNEGVTLVDGTPLPESFRTGAIIVPAGHSGPAFLVFGNFRSIKKYNNSTSYALAVGHLAERLAGGTMFAQNWPRHLRPLARSERMELQELLNTHGFEVGKVDGIIGARTKTAIRSFQQQRNEKADGFPTDVLLSSLRNAGGDAPATPSE